MTTSVEKWGDNSFLFELKPRSDNKASLFIDCPADEPNRTNEMVKLLEDRIEIGTGAECHQDLCDVSPKLVGRISELKLYPSTVGSLAWADQHRLFTCKVQAECTETVLVAKTIGRLVEDSKEGGISLDQFCRKTSSGKPVLNCTNCRQELLCQNGVTELQPLPCDDWYETAQSMEYFCHQHQHNGKSDHAARPNLAQWTPSKSRCLVSDSYLLIRSESTQNIVNKDLVLHCEQCLAEIGKCFRGGDTVFQLYHTCTNLTVLEGQVDYIKDRFSLPERYYCWLLLSHCENEASLKFLIRSCDKTPHMLIWLLDSYSVLARGSLTKCDDDGNSSHFRPFLAIKALYKLYDQTSAASDPRATGQDSSISIIEQPLAACNDLVKLFVDSTHSLPPACRLVGQFYVGYLRISDHVE